MKTLKCYKVFDENWKCRGFQYEVGKSYEVKGQPSLCEWGFHACRKVQDCFSYYSFDPKNKVAEVILSGIIIGTEGNKQCATKIKILKELSWESVLVIANAGSGNSGHSNSGDRNSGHSNSGDSNSGDRNSGHSNSGDSNSGDRNSGHRNSGDSNSGHSNSGHRNSGHSNSGHSNSGHRNSGHSNSGDRNSGHSNSGDSNSGDRNSGHRNSGDSNSGHSNSGHRNSGHSNSGHSNSGHRNSGHSNSGDRNSGHSNSGDRNSGDWNSGDWNSGDWNSGHRNSGYFNSKNLDTILVFNKPCKVDLWDSVRKPNFIFNIIINQWIAWSTMTDDEKKANKDAFVTDGYLKRIGYKEAWQTAYQGATKEDIKLLKALPNFNKKVFEEISGIKIK